MQAPEALQIDPEYIKKHREFDWERLIGRVAAWGGVAALVWGCINLYWANTSEHWPMATAIVKSSEIGKAVDPDNSSIYDYTVDVEYEYAVDGKHYVGSNIRFAMFERYSGREADQLVARLKKGRNIRVHYLSWWPSVSVIDPGVTIGSAWLPVIGITLIFVGTAESYRSKRRMRY